MKTENSGSEMKDGVSHNIAGSMSIMFASVSLDTKVYQSDVKQPRQMHTHWMGITSKEP